MLADRLRAAAVAVSFVAFAGCGAGPAAEQPSAAPIEVAVASYQGGAAAGEVVLPARVKAAEEVTLVARLAARLTAVRAREGARVRAGDVIAEFAAPEMVRALAAVRAEMAAAELSLAVAARQEARLESLFVARVVAERDREVAAAERRAAEARLASARAALDALTSGSTVRAPFDGVVVRLHADPGADLVPGAPLADLRSSAGIEVVADVPEGDAARLATASLSVQIGEGPWRPARLARLEGMTDWRSRSRTAHLVFDGGAEPGAYARVALSASAANPTGGTIPAASLVARGALSGVFVVEEDHARLRWLKLGRARGERVEVLAGLEPGERYALEPARLSDGAPVRARP
jgi:RND family efflux transporter MFP subunit